MSELSWNRVSVVYGTGRLARTVVSDVTLVARSGRVLGLVGESGSGKSTLANAAVGLVDVASGTVTLDGGPAVAARGDGGRRRRRVQMIFQDPYSSLDPRRTIGAAIAEALPASGVPRSRRASFARVSELVELVGLDRRLTGELPARLSGGMRQRVAIARVLAAEPDVIIADEITSALDVSVQASVLNLVCALQRELSLTVVFVSHNLAVTRYVSDDIAVMRAGGIVAWDTADAVLGSTDQPYVNELLAAIPELRGREGRS